MNSFNVKTLKICVRDSVQDGVHDGDHERLEKIKISLISFFCHKTAVFCPDISLCV